MNVVKFLINLSNSKSSFYQFSLFYISSQNNSSHSTLNTRRVECEKQIFAPGGIQTHDLLYSWQVSSRLTTRASRFRTNNIKANILIFIFWKYFSPQIHPPEPSAIEFRREKILAGAFAISFGVVCSVLPWGPCSQAERHLPQMQEVVGLNPTGSNICFHIPLYLEGNVKNCFVKLIYNYKNNYLVFAPPDFCPWRTPWRD